MHKFICIHGHFYQPPRENPWLGEIERQPEAAPYHDWNERITAECYRPNAHARILDSRGHIFKIIANYSRMNFDFGPTLLSWLKEKAPDVYQAILEADRTSQKKFSGHGNAIAQAYNHIIMPIANRHDKETQIIWGLRDFEFRFSRKPEGLWLPETAVDLEALEIMAEQGIAFTILAPHQARRMRKIGENTWQDAGDEKIDSKMAYCLTLPSGRKIALFFYNGPLSRGIAFERLLDDGETFARKLEGSFEKKQGSPQLAHVATDGETYGHHHRFGEMALAYVLDHIESRQDVKLTNYGEFLENHPPTHEVEIFENTSWSCPHGIERWKSHCGCHSGSHPGWNQAWRGPLREAFDWLRDQLIPLFEAEGKKIFKDPWSARNDSISVILDKSKKNIASFLNKQTSHALSSDEKEGALKLLELEHQAQLMYTSCGWFFDDISGIETVQVIQYAARALELARETTGHNFEPDFLKQLEKAKSNVAALDNGSKIFTKSVPSKLNFSMDSQPLKNPSTIAYFSMEIGIDPSIPTYSGGLGVLAGDTLKAAADCGLSMVGVSLLYRKGYFRQRLDGLGHQTEIPYEWAPEKYLEPMAPRISIVLGDRKVFVRAWRLSAKGIQGKNVEIYFLDADLPENSPPDRSLTDSLYGGDARMRLAQEALLGFGGIAMLRALGLTEIASYHMNEGHSALLTMALLEERTAGRGLLSANGEDHEAIRQKCVFTTHTPVPAGHDQFPHDLVNSVLGQERTAAIEAQGCCPKGSLNMTHLALFFSRYINGVAMRHGEISQDMFPHYPIESITNGVHAATWASPSFCALFDRHIPDWRADNFYLRHAINIPLDEIQKAHLAAKAELLAEIKHRTSITLNPQVMTIGFARRMTAYKRSDLLFSDLERLKKIAQGHPFQIIYAGKAHSRDEPGKELIRKIFGAIKALDGIIPAVYLEEYDMGLAKKLCAGVDLWLNTPLKPREASGTSGMKAAINGVPSLSVLDGWWIEGHIEGVTGWAVGDHWEAEDSPDREAASLYHKLEHIVLPLYYKNPESFEAVMRSTIAFNASFFNAQRMVGQYVKHAYSNEPPPRASHESAQTI